MSVSTKKMPISQIQQTNNILELFFKNLTSGWRSQNEIRFFHTNSSRCVLCSVSLNHLGCYSPKSPGSEIVKIRWFLWYETAMCHLEIRPTTKVFELFLHKLISESRSRSETLRFHNNFSRRVYWNRFWCLKTHNLIENDKFMKSCFFIYLYRKEA